MQYCVVLNTDIEARSTTARAGCCVIIDDHRHPAAHLRAPAVHTRVFSTQDALKRIIIVEIAVSARSDAPRTASARSNNCAGPRPGRWDELDGARTTVSVPCTAFRDRHQIKALPPPATYRPALGCACIPLHAAPPRPQLAGCLQAPWIPPAAALSWSSSTRNQQDEHQLCQYIWQPMGGAAALTTCQSRPAAATPRLCAQCAWARGCRATLADLVRRRGGLHVCTMHCRMFLRHAHQII